MEGVLDLRTQEGPGNFQPYHKKVTKRTKSGCLSCRARHTKCDEHKPICGGCARNHLLCSWTISKELRRSSVSAEHEPRSFQNNLPSSLPSVTSPGYGPSLWPWLCGKPNEQIIFQHYTEKSAQRLVTRSGTENPFLSYVLPLACRNDGFLHVLLAISASHMSFSDEKLHLEAISHYTIALRSLKYLITDLGRDVRSSPLEVILMLLLLCNFEVVDGNTKGAVIQHLRPWSALLEGHTNLLDQIDERCACFITEQFMFIRLVNQHLGLRSFHTNSDGSVASEPSDSLQFPYRSYYNGRQSGCAYELYEIIPRISLLASEAAGSSARYLDPDIANKFYAIEQTILLWEIPPSSNSMQKSDEDEITAAMFLQMALLTTLQCALHGPGIPSSFIRRQIDSCILEARSFLKRLSPSSMAWALLLWPLLHIGSCILLEHDQQDYVTTVLNMENKVPCCTSLIVFLTRIWRLTREGNGEFYGPYGIRELMNKDRIQPSLG